MTAQSPRTMVEMSQIKNLHSFHFSGIKLRRKTRGIVTSKVENLVFYKHETAVLFAEGFAEKMFPFFSSAREHQAAQHDVCVKVQENIQQRSVTDVWKCTRTSSSVA